MRKWIHSVWGLVLQEQPEGGCRSPVWQWPNLPLGVSSCSTLDAAALHPSVPRARAGPPLQVAALTVGMKSLVLPQPGLWGSLQLFILFVFSK